MEHAPLHGLNDATIIVDESDSFGGKYERRGEQPLLSPLSVDRTPLCTILEPRRPDPSGSGDDYAGDGSPILYLAIDMPGWYQACTQRNGWLPAVRGYDASDREHGCAGDGSPVTAVRCYYETQNPAATGWLGIEYAVADVGCGFLPDMVDLRDAGGTADDFAGDGGVAGAFRARIVAL